MPIVARACIRVCFDLAGVDKANVDLRIEPKRLILRGTRPTPEPASAEGRPSRFLPWRSITGLSRGDCVYRRRLFPGEVTAEQRDGLLWINLPLRSAP